MMEKQKKNVGGRPRKADDEKLVKLNNGIKKKTLERFELIISESRRSYWLDNAITLALDIEEGKRNLPELLTDTDVKEAT